MVQPGTKRNASTSRDKKLTADLRRESEASDAPCGICSEPIDYTLRYPHPESFSRDHILPWKHYPELRYELSNQQASHLLCNQNRQDNPLELAVGITSEQW